jgi:hypothetical protein
MSRAAADLRAHWNNFCDADPVPDNFIERMEKAGFAHLRAVTDDDIDAFSSDRGIEAGGTLWALTTKGRAAFRKPEPRT